MGTLAQFEQRIRLYAARAGVIGDEAVKAAARATLRKLAETTPVDTGLALSNWQVGIGYVPSGERSAYVPGTQGSTAAANRAAVLEAGLTTIDTYKSGTRLAVHIGNNAKHIGALNDGHSKQAPANFVEMAVQAGRRAVHNLRVSFK